MFANFSLFLQQISTKKIAFIGIGISNLNVINLIIEKCKNPSSLYILDSDDRISSNKHVLKLTQLGVNLICGKNYLQNLINFDIIVRSPGVYFYKPEIQNAIKSGVVVTSELELFFNFCPCQIVAVTGSDGKTTTTSLIAEMLKNQGFKVHLGGNIGQPLFSKIEEIEPSDMAVVEISSFQLISMRKSPNIAIITNISPNHLDVHKNMEEYIAAKLNLIAHQSAFDFAVLNANNEFVEKCERETRSFVKKFSSQTEVENGAFLSPLDRSTIFYSKNSNKTPVLKVDEIALPGMHNVENYLAAISAVFEMVSIDAIKKTAKNFKGVNHRLEFVMEANEVKWFNDSIATTPTRTIAALECFKRGKIILIAGGYDKKISFDNLAEKILEKVRVLILLGATAQKIELCLKNCPNFEKTTNFTLKHVQTMEQAIDLANELSVKDDSVVLSPACASFDMYKNFEERGLAFKNILINKFNISK